MATNPEKLTQEVISVLVATATFRRMRRDDYAFYAGAGRRTLICDDHPCLPDAVMLLSTENEGHGQRTGDVEIDGFNEGTATSWCVAVIDGRVQRLI